MKRPKIVINCAMSADGKIALPTKKQLRISCEKDIERMYKLRHDSDAILVGINTILSDDPKLTVKEKYVKNPHQPIRIILDSNCKTPVDALAVNTQAKTWIITSGKCNKKFKDNVEIIKCETDAEGLIDLEDLLEMLYNREIKTLLVEGGSTVIWNFLNNGLVDDIYVYMAPIIIGGSKTPTMADGEGIKSLDELINLEIVNVKRLGPGILFHFKMII
ncbi:MAG: 2,5-diamino-6-(ribosylamino)-4(3H)-pyrimidinone 5'-phosphate reductase [Thermoplasmatales archaeon]|nr:MAG: 2,5-diamino-6-(ribosylamino)-4(3H)-pyrimidinone 5'-phosphate reductase [Thermoplasmatales archaeon]